MSNTASRHKWNFFRAGGFDQVRLDSGGDIVHIAELDQKLWVALACPTRGVEFDPKTLDLIDTDHDGRIRAPEIIAACKWATSMLKNPDDLLKSAAALPLASINDATPDGKNLLSSARQTLINLGKGDATVITTDDTADTARIFAQTQFNGDGIIPPDAAEDPKLQAIINDIIVCLGAETDRSGKPGIAQGKLDLFFTDAAAFVGWYGQADGDEQRTKEVMPMGANTPAAAAALKAVAGKIEDFFARCRLAAFDPRATAAVNLADDQYAAIAVKNLSLAGADFTALPLARVEPGRPLPLTEGLNPGWRAAMDMFNAQVIKPLLGEKLALTELDWATLVSKFAAFDAWLAAKAGTSIEKLGLPRVQEILAYTGKGGAGAKTIISDLIAKDVALRPEAESIAAVDRLVRYHRDLYKLLNNFVAFRDFYSRRDKAIFQVGTLYLDQRACELCIRVDDPAKHAAMSHLAYTYLAYCDMSRKVTGEKMTVACAFTAGDSDNLMVGRNGLFYDRQGNDWDATITKITEHPISIRQAFWSPYKRLARWIQDQIAKRAAAADAASQTHLQSAAAVSAVPVAPPAPVAPKKVDVGMVAAIGVALGSLSTAFGYLLGWLGGVPLVVIPLYVIVVILLISTPSMILAAMKLRQRNLGPILDANGWAVNARAKINIPFGGSLTHTPKLPPGSHRDMIDPFAETHRARNWAIAIGTILIILGTCWYMGLADRYIPGILPESPLTKQRDAAADQMLTDAAAALKENKIDAASATLAKLEEMKNGLSLGFKMRVDALETKVEAAKNAAANAPEVPTTKPSP